MSRTFSEVSPRIAVGCVLLLLAGLIGVAGVVGRTHRESSPMVQLTSNQQVALAVLEAYESVDASEKSEKTDLRFARTFFRLMADDTDFDRWYEWATSRAGEQVQMYEVLFELKHKVSVEQYSRKLQSLRERYVPPEVALERLMNLACRVGSGDVVFWQLATPLYYRLRSAPDRYFVRPWPEDIALAYNDHCLQRQ